MGNLLDVYNGNKDIRIEVTYSEHGYISAKRVTESEYLLLEFLTDAEKTNDYLNDFLKSFKKALTLFNSQKVYDVNIYLAIGCYPSTNVFLITQKYDDKEAGVYTLYDYTDRTNVKANITKVSKQVVIKRFKEEVTRILQDANII